MAWAHGRLLKNKTSDVKLSPRCSCDCHIAQSPPQTKQTSENFGRRVGGTLRGSELESAQTNHHRHVNACARARPPHSPPGAAAASWDPIKASARRAGNTEEAQPLRWVRREQRKLSCSNPDLCFGFCSFLFVLTPLYFYFTAVSVSVVTMKAVALILALAVITGECSAPFAFTSIVFYLLCDCSCILTICTHFRLQRPCCAPGRCHPKPLGGNGKPFLAVYCWCDQTSWWSCAEHQGLSSHQGARVSSLFLSSLISVDDSVFLVYLLQAFIQCLQSNWSLIIIFCFQHSDYWHHVRAGSLQSWNPY